MLGGQEWMMIVKAERRLPDRAGPMATGGQVGRRPHRGVRPATGPALRRAAAAVRHWLPGRTGGTDPGPVRLAPAAPAIWQIRLKEEM